MVLVVEVALPVHGRALLNVMSDQAKAVVLVLVTAWLLLHVAFVEVVVPVVDCWMLLVHQLEVPLSYVEKVDAQSLTVETFQHVWTARIGLGAPSGSTFQHVRAAQNGLGAPSGNVAALVHQLDVPLRLVKGADAAAFHS